MRFGPSSRSASSTPARFVPSVGGCRSQARAEPAGRDSGVGRGVIGGWVACSAISPVRSLSGGGGVGSGCALPSRGSASLGPGTPTCTGPVGWDWEKMACGSTIRASARGAGSWRPTSVGCPGLVRAPTAAAWSVVQRIPARAGPDLLILTRRRPLGRIRRRTRLLQHACLPARPADNSGSARQPVRIDAQSWISQ
jgi:hypothetical protein